MRFADVPKSHFFVFCPCSDAKAPLFFKGKDGFYIVKPAVCFPFAVEKYGQEIMPDAKVQLIDLPKEIIHETFWR